MNNKDIEKYATLKNCTYKKWYFDKKNEGEFEFIPFEMKFFRLRNLVIKDFSDLTIVWSKMLPNNHRRMKIGEVEGSINMVSADGDRGIKIFRNDGNDEETEKVMILATVFSDAYPEKYSQYIHRILHPDLLPTDDPMIWTGFYGGMDHDLEAGGFSYHAMDGLEGGSFRYSDGINLFYNYFKSFEIYVDQYMGSPTSEEKWYLEFKKELPNLEVIYKDLVERGEIVEVKQPAVG